MGRWTLAILVGFIASAILVGALFLFLSFPPVTWTAAVIVPLAFAAVLQAVKWARQKSYADAFFARIPTVARIRRSAIWVLDAQLRTETTRMLLVEHVDLEISQGDEVHILHHAGQDETGSNSLIPGTDSALPTRFRLVAGEPTKEGKLRFIDRQGFEDGSVDVLLIFFGRSEKEQKAIPLGQFDVSPR